MEPGAEVLLAAERIRQSLERSEVWAPALARSGVNPSVALVLPLLEHDISYYLVEITRANLVTARFVLDTAGTLLEAEGDARPVGALVPWVRPPRRAPGGPGDAARVRLVWKPCDQSKSRLRPFWEVAANGVVHYVRVDGTTFNQLTITGRG